MQKLTVLFTLAVINFACDDSSGSGPGDAGVDAQSDTSLPDTGGDLGPDAADAGPMDRAPFFLQVEQSATVGVVGQAFDIRATVAGEAADVTWAWDAPEGAVEGDGDSVSVRFEAPGQYEIQVQATAEEHVVEGGALVVVHDPAAVLEPGDINGDSAIDAADQDALEAFVAGTGELSEDAEARGDLNRDGDVDAVDVEVLDQILAAGELVATWPAAGSRGTAIQVAHPLFIDPAARPTVRFDDEVVPVTRGTPGYALVIVPLSLDRAGTAEIVVESGDQLHRFPFDVLDPPVPGDEVPQSFDELLAAYEILPALMADLATELDLPAEEAALLQAFLVALEAELSAAQAQFRAEWDRLPQDVRDIYTEVALANGLDRALVELAAIRDGIQALPQQISNERLFELMCLARDMGKVTRIISTVNNIAGYVIDTLWFLSFIIPPLTPVVAALSTANTFFTEVMDAMEFVLGFAPRLGDSLTVKAMPEALARGESTQAQAFTNIQIAGGLCAGGAAAGTKRLLDMMKDRLFKRIFGRIPGFGRYYRKARHKRGLVARLVTSIARALGQIIDEVVERSGINDRIQSLVAAACDAVFGSRERPLERGVMWGANCGGQVVDGEWTCTDECADRRVTIAAGIRVCGMEARGSVQVECAGCRAECPDGCCTADGDCVGQAEQSDMQCGSAGGRCLACGEGERCEEGECRCISTCAAEEEGTTRCADATVVETCQQVEDACWRWAPTDCAENGATCEDGECTGGCGPWNCAGCCTAEHACVEVEDTGPPQCGRDGARCKACLQGDECVGGVCVCRGPNCDPRPPAGSRGDPHLDTFDGLAYDFQAAGEFVLVVDVEAREDALEVQVRQAPLGDSNCPASVTVNTAVAVRIGAHRITYDRARPALVWLDGAPAELPLELPAGAVTRDDNTVAVEWTDGSTVVLDARGAVDISAHAERPVVGLLGSNDGDVTNDVAIRGGEALPRPAPFDRLYGEYADSWRVDAETSLFDYGADEGPETYAIPGFPESLATVDALDEAVRESAEEMCRTLGLEDETILAGCIIDLACTGDAGYVAGMGDRDAPMETLGVTPPPGGGFCGRTGTEFLFAEDALPCPVDFGGFDMLFCQDCPAGCPLGDVWGTDRYHEESVLCTAAVHAGVIDRAAGGTIYFLFPQFDDPYQGSLRNGVQSQDRAPHPVSIRFIPEE